MSQYGLEEEQFEDQARPSRPEGLFDALVLLLTIALALVLVWSMGAIS